MPFVPVGVPCEGMPTPTVRPVPVALELMDEEHPRRLVIVRTCQRYAYPTYTVISDDPFDEVDACHMNLAQILETYGRDVLNHVTQILGYKTYAGDRGEAYAEMLSLANAFANVWRQRNPVEVHHPPDRWTVRMLSNLGLASGASSYAELVIQPPSTGFGLSKDTRFRIYSGEGVLAADIPVDSITAPADFLTKLGEMRTSFESLREA